MLGGLNSKGKEHKMWDLSKFLTAPFHTRKKHLGLHLLISKMKGLNEKVTYFAIFTSYRQVILPLIHILDHMEDLAEVGLTGTLFSSPRLCVILNFILKYLRLKLIT